MMPIKEAESIMISKYPVYNKKEVFTTNIDNVLEFITMFRNKKAELGNIGEYKVYIDIDDETSKDIIINMLKLSDKISLEDGNGIKIEYAGMKASIIYDNSKSLEEEKEKLLKEKESLQLQEERNFLVIVIMLRRLLKQLLIKIEKLFLKKKKC